MDEQVHKPKGDGTCSLFCTCTTPLTKAELTLLDELGLF